MGAKAKITPPQIYIIAVVLSIISAVVIFFTLIKPNQDEYKLKYDDDQNQLATIAKKPAAVVARKEALHTVAVANAKWAVYDKRYMPNIDLTNRYTAMRQVWHEEIEVLGPKIEKFLRDDHSVQVLTDGLTTPTPPADPNAVIVKSYTFPLGTFSVVGTFNDDLNHIARWNKLDRLVMVDHVTLSGSSPRVVCQYTLTLFETTHADAPGIVWPAAAPPTVPSGGSSGSSSSGGFEVTTPNGGGNPAGPSGYDGSNAGRPAGPGGGGVLPSGGPGPVQSNRSLAR